MLLCCSFFFCTAHSQKKHYSKPNVLFWIILLLCSPAGATDEHNICRRFCWRKVLLSTRKGNASWLCRFCLVFVWNCFFSGMRVLPRPLAMEYWSKLTIATFHIIPDIFFQDVCGILKHAEAYFRILKHAWVYCSILRNTEAYYSILRHSEKYLRVLRNSYLRNTWAYWRNTILLLKYSNAWLK